MVAKCLVVHDFNDIWYPPPPPQTLNSASVQRIVNGNLDLGWPLGAIRVGHMRNDLSGWFLLDGHYYNRAAYISFSLSPCHSDTPGWPPAPPYMDSRSDGGAVWWENTRLMMSGDWIQDQPHSDLYSYGLGVDVYSNYGDANHIAYALDGISPSNSLVLTSKGRDKITKALIAANVLRGNGWSVAFGFTNEPNNLGGYTCTVSPNNYDHYYWWPMQSRFYAYLYRALAGAVVDIAHSIDPSWAPSIGMADVSHYTSSGSSPLDMTWYSQPDVPPEYPGGPDSRYLNLVLHWWDYDGLSWLSPESRDIQPNFFTYHQYDS